MKKRLAGAALGLLVLAGLELTLRARSRPAPQDSPPFRFFDPELHHTLAKNVTATSLWGNRRVTYHTNSLGWRDERVRKVPLGRPPGGRIVLLGDSFVEGIGVEFPSTAAALLAKELRGNGNEVEVLNGGVVSLCPSLSYRKLKAFLDGGYEADRVVFFYDISDPHDEAVFYKDWKGDPRLPEDPRPLLLRLLETRLHAWLAFRNWEDSAGQTERGLWTESPRLFKRWGREGTETGQRFMESMAGLCRERGIAFEVVIAPWPAQLLSGRRPSPQETLTEEWGRRQGVRVVNLFPDFFSLPDWRSRFIPGDCHWNESGHQFAAEQLAKALRERGNTAPNLSGGDPSGSMGASQKAAPHGKEEGG